MIDCTDNGRFPLVLRGCSDTGLLVVFVLCFLCAAPKLNESQYAHIASFETLIIAFWMVGMNSAFE